ncbi:MAG TPA: hypothetical protein VHG93_08020 [Longimicrobium sp.]|nr:hypothetical protein [Longimicrobium sp.]
MEPYDLDLLRHDLAAWMEARFLEPIAYVEGGWEYWIQIDFVAWLDNEKHTVYDFRREIPAQGGRLDWVINSGYPESLTAIEIKAQTPKYKTDAFVADVWADVVWLAGLDGFAHRGMLAAAVDAKAAELLEGLGFQRIVLVNNAALYFRAVQAGEKLTPEALLAIASA